MNRLIRFKEAFKTGLAMAVAYGIALQLDWMNPSWAGWGVAMIALSTAGQSLHKGFLRVLGTVPGCIAALAILGLAPQSRWLFIGLVCLWVFFTTYMMLADKKRAYLWNVAGFVCLIISLTGPTSSESVFNHAMYRTLETILGVSVYTLISVFLWPRTNAGAIRATSGDVCAAQGKLFHSIFSRITVRDAGADDWAAQYAQQLQRLGQLDGALLAEGAESYAVREVRPLWERLQQLGHALAESADRFHHGLAEFQHLQLEQILPELTPYCDALEARMALAHQALLNGADDVSTVPLALSVDRSALRTLTHYERAAVMVAKAEFERMAQLSEDLLACVSHLTVDALEHETMKSAGLSQAKQGLIRFKMPDRDHVRGAFFVALCAFAGFLLWIFIDPPGHASWMMLPATVAMAIAGAQQVKVTMFIRPLAVALALCMSVYVFIMPQLSSYWGLGPLIFSCMFVVCYWFTGVARLMGMIAIINIISISNPQTYSFAAMANVSLFMIGSFGFLYVLSYTLGSSRPEKVLCGLMRRFLRSVECLLSELCVQTARPSSAWRRLKIAFYRQELQRLPAKIAGWSKAINHQHFPDNTGPQISALVAQLQVLVYRVDDLMEASELPQVESVTSGIEANVAQWRDHLSDLFGRWSASPEIEALDAIKQLLVGDLKELEQQLNRTLEELDGTSHSDADCERFYRFLGSVRGVSAATVSYAGAANSIQWAQWREEVFS
jgi:uncharacterized membrane protein YccC